jgi:hypothetical protein
VAFLFVTMPRVIVVSFVIIMGFFCGLLYVRSCFVPMFVVVVARMFVLAVGVRR